MAGEKIRKLRKEKKLTPKDITKATGLSIRYISQSERGAVEPSLSSLRKVNGFLGVSPYSSADRLERHSAMVESDQKPVIKFPKSEIFCEIVSPISTSRHTLSSIVVRSQIELGGRDSEEFSTRLSEEIVILLQGKADMVLGETSCHLNTGDPLTVRPNMPHGAINTGETPAIGFCMMTPMG